MTAEQAVSGCLGSTTAKISSALMKQPRQTISVCSHEALRADRSVYRILTAEQAVSICLASTTTELSSAKRDTAYANSPVAWVFAAEQALAYTQST